MCTAPQRELALSRVQYTLPHQLTILLSLAIVSVMRPLQKLTLEQRRVLTDILVTTSQVTFGIAWATLLFPPLDAVKGLAILVSVVATIVLWYFAFYLTKVKKL